MSDSIVINPTVGDVVRYSDMANPGSTYIVIALPDGTEKFTPSGLPLPPSTGYQLRSVEKPYSINSSDLRQAGWRIYRGSYDQWEKIRVAENV